jgi:hypothetical protein
MTLAPGWADAIAKGVASKSEPERAEALGVKPRRNFKIDRARQRESAARGGRLGRRRRNYREDGSE